MGHSQAGNCYLCDEQAAMQFGLEMNRVECGHCKTYEIAAEIVAELERDSDMRERLPFISAASKRAAAQGETLRIETKEHFMLIAADEHAIQQEEWRAPKRPAK